MTDFKYSIHTENIEAYVSYLAGLSGWEIHKIGNIKIVFNGHNKSLFNYVFCDETTKEADVVDVLNFLKEKNWEMTWPIEPSFSELIHILEKYKVSRVSNPKKAYIKVKNFYFKPEENLNLEFILSDTEEKIDIFDRTVSDIFYHNHGFVNLFMRGIKEEIESNMKAFLVKLNGELVGTCIMFINGKNVGFYADGVIRKFRNKRIGSHMIAKRMKIASELGCDSVIAHCMSQSINMYERSGFRMLGTLYLYVSVP